MNYCGGKFPLYTILSNAIELFKRLEVLHKNGILHKDIKPSSIVFGNFSTKIAQEKGSFYLVDYPKNIWIITKIIINTKLIENL